MIKTKKEGKNLVDKKEWTRFDLSIYLLSISTYTSQLEQVENQSDNEGTNYSSNKGKCHERTDVFKEHFLLLLLEETRRVKVRLNERREQKGKRTNRSFSYPLHIVTGFENDGWQEDQKEDRMLKCNHTI